MCHACVIEGVRKSMLSRRGLVRGAAAAGLAVRCVLAQSGGMGCNGEWGMTHDGSRFVDFGGFSGRLHQ